MIDFDIFQTGKVKKYLHKSDNYLYLVTFSSSDEKVSQYGTLSRFDRNNKITPRDRYVKNKGWMTLRKSGHNITNFLTLKEAESIIVLDEI